MDEEPPEPSRVGTTTADSASPHRDDIKGSHASATTPPAKSAVSNESEKSTNPTGDDNDDIDSAYSPKQQNQPPHDKQQRGKRPRSKRNRKRARSQVHGSNDDLVIQSKVIPLTLNGQPIFTGIPYSSSQSSSGNCKSDDAEPSDAADAAAAAAAQCIFVRVIEPYPYTFTSHAKSRWIGRTILDVYAREFGSYPESYYETAIRQGRILVSDELVDPSYCIRQHDVLCHIVHRHEPAVLLHCNTAPYVKIVGETDTLLAVDKPGTLPIHPCGGYHENCLLQLLEPRYGKLYTIYRLDRLTSGLVIFGKTSAAAQVCSTAMKEHRDNCHKIYMARVKGQFPRNCPSHVPALSQINTCNRDDATSSCKKNHRFPIDGVRDDDTIENGNDKVTAMRGRNAFGYWFSNLTDSMQSQNVSLERFSTMEHTAEEWLQALDQKKRQSNDNHDDHDHDSSFCTRATPDLVWLDFACPVRTSNPKIGVCECGTFDNLSDETYVRTVKPAQTSFAVIRYHKSSDSTIVLCRPMTGRTHQIRLHLQQLGHPIANDPNYGGDDIFFYNPQGESTRRQAQAALNAVAAAKQDEHDADCLDDENKSNEPQPSQQEEVKYLRTCDDPATQGEVDRIVETKRGDDESWDEYIRRTCVWCQRDSDTTLELLVRSPGVWLHALQYSLETGDKTTAEEKISFRTQLPDWSTC